MERGAASLSEANEPNTEFVESIRFPTDEDVAGIGLISVGQSGVNAVAYSADSQRYVIAKDRTIVGLDLGDHEQLVTLVAHGLVETIALSRDGTTLAATSEKSGRYYLDVWALNGERLHADFAMQGPTSVEVSDDGSYLCWYGGRDQHGQLHTIRWRDCLSWGSLRAERLPDARLGTIRDIAFNAEGTKVAAVCGSQNSQQVAVWDLSRNVLIGKSTKKLPSVFDDTLQFDSESQISAKVSDGSRRIVFP
ncbi:MAG TPA: hypothetical protein P5307_28935, partial [Pirellulaceae bacterium]|nr:hypothetical protein [Pirellulaceae bacterium]